MRATVGCDFLTLTFFSLVMTIDQMSKNVNYIYNKINDVKKNIDILNRLMRWKVAKSELKAR